MGPLNNQPQLDFVVELVEKARQAGASILCGGSRPVDDRLAKGLFYPPTVVVCENDALDIVKEEQLDPFAGAAL